MAKSTDEKNAELQRLIARFDDIVFNRKFEELQPFLQNEIYGFREGFKKHVQRIKQHLNENNRFPWPMKRNGTWETWGTRGDDEQCKIINLTAAVVLEVNNVNSSFEMIQILSNYRNDSQARAFLKWAKPKWIVPNLLERFDKGEWFEFDYQALRQFEADEIIEFEPRLFGLSLGSWRVHFKKDVIEKLIWLANDSIAIERDIPLLFEYETMLSGGWIKTEIEGQETQIWEYLFQKLLAERKLNRKFFIEKTLQIQTKNWNPGRKIFFRKQLEAAQPTPEELLEQQQNIFPLLHDPHPHVVNFGTELLKKIHQQAQFDLDQFLDWLPPVLMRQDLKSSIKRCLQMLDHFLKNQPERRGQLLAAAADVFVVPDLELQEQAARRILKFWEKTADDLPLREKLELYHPQMLGSVRQEFAKILGDVAELETAPAAETNYIFQPKKQPLLLEKIALPNDWNEVLFLVSRYLSSREPLDAELILATFSTRREIFPADFQAQLQPLLNQVSLWNFSEYVDCNNVMNGFLLANLEFLQDGEPLENTQKQTTFYIHRLLKRLALLTHRKIERKSVLPLLCLPTHQPFWVEPKTLLQRLIDYQTVLEPIDKLDLAIAISRMPRENVAEALELLPQVPFETRELMAFCLGESSQISVKTEKNWASKLLSFVGGRSENDSETALWAVAARTFDRDGVFPEFEKTNLGDAPNVVRAFNPEISIGRKKRQVFEKTWGSGNYVIPASTSLNILFPKFKSLPLHLIYSLELFDLEDRDFNFWGGGDESYFKFWLSLLPQNPMPLVWRSIRSDWGFKTILQIVSRPEIEWTRPLRFAFCMAFYHDDKPTRFAANEVLNQLIEQNRLDAAAFGRQLGDFVFHKFNALARLLAGLESVKDVSPKHNSALFQILDSLFARFFELAKAAPDEPLPTNFKKMLEHFADLQVKTHGLPSAAALDCFQFLEKNSSLKKLISQIKSFKK